MPTSIKENISRNIAKYRKAKGLSQGALADIVGVKKFTTVSSWERGISSPDADTIIKLCELFGITLYDLYEVDNKQDSLSSEQRNLLRKYKDLDEHGKEVVDYILEKEYTRSIAEFAETPLYSVPYAYDLPASAGTGEYAMDIAHFKNVGLSEEPPRKADFLIRVAGDSMEPKFSDGDRVFVQRMDAIEAGEIGLFYFDGDVYIKKLGQNELISLNAAYPPIPVKEFASFRCFGKVLGKCTCEITEI